MSPTDVDGKVGAERSAKGRRLTLAQLDRLEREKAAVLETLHITHPDRFDRFVWCVANKDTQLHPFRKEDSWRPVAKNWDTLHKGSVVLCEAFDDGDGTRQHAKDRWVFGTAKSCRVYRVCERIPRDSVEERNARLIKAGTGVGAAAAAAVGGAVGSGVDLFASYFAFNDLSFATKGALAAAVGGSLKGRKAFQNFAHTWYKNLEEGEVLTADLDHCRPVEFRKNVHPDGNVTVGIAAQIGFEHLPSDPSQDGAMPHTLPLSYVYDSCMMASAVDRSLFRSKKDVNAPPANGNGEQKVPDDVMPAPPANAQPSAPPMDTRAPPANAVPVFPPVDTPAAPRRSRSRRGRRRKKNREEKTHSDEEEEEDSAASEDDVPLWTAEERRNGTNYGTNNGVNGGTGTRPRFRAAAASFVASTAWNKPRVLPARRPLRTQFKVASLPHASLPQ